MNRLEEVKAALAELMKNMEKLTDKEREEVQELLKELATLAD